MFNKTSSASSNALHSMVKEFVSPVCSVPPSAMSVVSPPVSVKILHPVEL